MRRLGPLLPALLMFASTAQAAPSITEPHTLTKPGFGIVTGPDGALWVSERDNPGIVGRVTLAGGLAEFEAELTPGFTKDRKPTGMAVGADGALWFVQNTSPGYVARITVGGVVSEFGPLSGTPTAIAAGPDGHLWVTEADADIGPLSSVGGAARIATDGTVVSEITTGSANPTHITAGPDGAMWFTEPGAVGKVTTAGVVTKHATALAPAGIVAGPDSALYFAAVDTIGHTTTGGTVTALPTPLLDQATAIAAGPDGALWFTVTNAIGRLRPDGAVSIHSAGLTPDYPATAIAPGPDGAMWFTKQDGRLGRITVPPYVGEAFPEQVTAATGDVRATVRANASPTTVNLQLRGPGNQVVATDQVQVPPGPGPVEIVFSLTGLSASTLYTATVTATSAAGAALGPAVTAFMTAPEPAPAPTPTPTPTVAPTTEPSPSPTAEPTPAEGPTATPSANVVPLLQETVVVEPSRGTVRVKSENMPRFTKLSDIGALPVGALVDTRKGEVRLESELPDGTVQAGFFRGGLFRVSQARSGMTTVRLTGRLSCASDRTMASTSRKRKRKRKRKIWGRDSGGKFRTHGRDSVATVRGTRWLTMDTCRGTVTRVVEGSVRVRPKRGGRPVIVEAGERLLTPRS